jgi:hypothetical protein
MHVGNRGVRSSGAPLIKVGKAIGDFSGNDAWIRILRHFLFEGVTVAKIRLALVAAILAAFVGTSVASAAPAPTPNGSTTKVIVIIKHRRPHRRRHRHHRHHRKTLKSPKAPTGPQAPQAPKL